ncbi:MAG: hypothetical protein FWB80_00200 [Defluviitaleaceae bacterium]|nr:hypothetical protein [Defluviitaleaceae bacterium]
MSNLLPMYPGAVNSIESTTTTETVAADTTITVQDPSVLIPSIPCLLVLGGNVPNAETILVTAQNGNTLTVQRGYQGIAQAWPLGTSIANNFTEAQYRAMVENIKTVDNETTAQFNNMANDVAGRLKRADPGVWVSGMAVQPNDVVTHNNQLFRAIIASSGGTAPDAGTALALDRWEQMTPLPTAGQIGALHYTAPITHTISASDLPNSVALSDWYTIAEFPDMNWSIDVNLILRAFTITPGASNFIDIQGHLVSGQFRGTILSSGEWVQTLNGVRFGTSAGRIVLQLRFTTHSTWLGSDLHVSVTRRGPTPMIGFTQLLQPSATPLRENLDSIGSVYAPDHGNLQHGLLTSNPLAEPHTYTLATGQDNIINLPGSALRRLSPRYAMMTAEGSFFEQVFSCLLSRNSSWQQLLLLDLRTVHYFDQFGVGGIGVAVNSATQLRVTVPPSPHFTSVVFKITVW